MAKHRIRFIQRLLFLHLHRQCALRLFRNAVRRSDHGNLPFAGFHFDCGGLFPALLQNDGGRRINQFGQGIRSLLCQQLSVISDRSRTGIHFPRGTDASYTVRHILQRTGSNNQMSTFIYISVQFIIDLFPRTKLIGDNQDRELFHYP